MSPKPVIPPVLYLPVVNVPNGSGQQFVVRGLSDGRTGLLAYTALDRLATSCGDEQPWVLLAIEDLDRVKQAQPFDVVAFDLAVPGEFREGRHLR